MMQLVAGVGHRRLADDLRIALRLGIDVDHRDGVGRLAVRIEAAT
jgi:hypothetical protein